MMRFFLVFASFPGGAIIEKVASPGVPSVHAMMQRIRAQYGQYQVVITGFTEMMSEADANAFLSMPPTSPPPCPLCRGQSLSIPPHPMATVKLTTVDAPADPLVVPMDVAKWSVTIKHMIEDFGGDDACANVPIPLHNVTLRILRKVVDFCEYHEQHPITEAVSEGHELPTGWDATFLTGLDTPTLFELILAANYLDIKPLLDMTCRRVAALIKDKSVEEIRTLFNIKNDFTPEEEARIVKENAWVDSV